MKRVHHNPAGVTTTAERAIRMQRCAVCGAMRSWSGKWRLEGKPQPYCPGAKPPAQQVGLDEDGGI